MALVAIVVVNSGRLDELLPVMSAQSRGFAGRRAARRVLIGAPAVSSRTSGAEACRHEGRRRALIEAIALAA